MTKNADQPGNFTNARTPLPAGRDRPAGPPVPGLAPSESPPAKPYFVFVDDNFHYMDESERTAHGNFATLEEAIAACKALVDEYFSLAYKPGMPASDLYDSYVSFGDDPFIMGRGLSTPPFSAWTYAKTKAQEICGAAAESQPL